MLSIYLSTSPSTEFSNSATFTNPLAIAVDGQTGAVIARKYYVRNDDNTKYYNTITVTPVVLTGTDIISGVNAGFTWKLIAGDTEPNEIQWGAVAAGNSISLANVGSLGSADITTYLPFWLRIEVPRGVDVQTLQNVTLQISMDELAA